ncbi:hypothetical protein DY000_02038892 [Brassica cretica]|uniref:Uncharacterized protein n=1 Tax=Brassica cretica TaxID=69181 RepID=A0ABQ7BNX2_BRACR|nr:hypothetical protein DY000_02038892 [Brassica cretica]
MTSRHTRSNAQGPLHQLTNEELARLERQNRQQPRPTDTTMAGQGNQDDLTAALEMLQMQQTIQNQQQDAHQAAENAVQEERGAPIGERNLPRNFATNRLWEPKFALSISV